MTVQTGFDLGRGTGSIFYGPFMGCPLRRLNNFVLSNYNREILGEPKFLSEHHLFVKFDRLFLSEHYLFFNFTQSPSENSLLEPLAPPLSLSTSSPSARILQFLRQPYNSRDDF